jgi:peptidoglycan/xylan/chitin deacetylase (PgdA/CDA1 family)
MKRFVALLLCAAALWGTVLAAEPETVPAGYVALTFDDGPSGRFTSRLLDGLAQRGAVATFFLCGYRIEQYPQLMERYDEEGHEIGIHGYSHGYMHTMSYDALTKELTDTAGLIAETAGVCPVLLRPPGGLTGDVCETVAREQDLGVILWSVDPEDWRCSDADQVACRVLDRVTDGDVVLMHDMSDSSVDAALTIVDTLQSRGFRLVTVSQLAELRGQAVACGQIYRRFSP